MINPKLKEKILPYLKMDVDKKHHNNLDVLFNEVYLVIEDGKGKVCIRSPEAEYLALMYNAINGAYEGIDFWDIISMKGELL